MADLNESALEAALEGAMGGTPDTPAPAEPDEPLVEAGALEAEEAPAAEAAPKAEAAPEPELELEIEVNGTVEVIKGKDAIKEYVQKGRDYTIKTEQVARARDSLLAQAQAFQAQQRFYTEASGDMTAIQALDAQLEQFSKIDWQTAYETDPFKALSLREHRDSLKEQRENLLNQFHAKRDAFQQSQAEAAQRMIAAEQAALLNKLPEWRNTERAQKEQREIAASLRNYGFNDAEIDTLRDHRMLLVARDAYQWRALQAGKADGLKQVRQAPPVVKPGALPKDNAKAQGKDVLRDIRSLGRKGQTRAQEELVAKALERAYK